MTRSWSPDPGSGIAIERIDAVRRNVARQFAALVFGGPQPHGAHGEAAFDWFASDDADIAKELELKELMEICHD